MKKFTILNTPRHLLYILERGEDLFTTRYQVKGEEKFSGTIEEFNQDTDNLKKIEPVKIEEVKKFARGGDRIIITLVR